MNKRKVLQLLLKIILSSAALFYVFSKIDLKEVGSTIKEAEIIWVVLAFLIFSVSQIVASQRLLVLFKLLGSKITFLQNIKLYWLGLFYNLFLPGGVGGDGFKIYLIHKYEKVKLKKIIGAILSDRVSGLTIIVMMLLLLLSNIPLNFPFIELSWTLIPWVALGYFLFLHLFFRNLQKGFAPTLAWALLAQTLQMIAAILILRSLDASTLDHLENYIFLFFLSAIAGSIPITLGGIGARELVFIEGAGYLGIDMNIAVALSLLFYVVSAISALPGLIYTLKPSTILPVKDVEFIVSGDK